MDPATTPITLKDAIARRCSSRRYLPKPVPRELIQQLLDAAVRAPTALHEEQWAFVVIEGRERLASMSAKVRSLLEQAWHEGAADGPTGITAEAGFDLFYDATTLILICTQPTGAFVAPDCWLAAENALLTATALGLGTCVIGSAVAGLNTSTVKAELGIADEIQVVVPIIVGWPATESTPGHRNPPVILKWLGGPN
jgi:nitroreductase